MHNYFCGWYFKCQSETQTVAIIPAVHKTKGKASCSVQLITESGAWNIPFAFDRFHKGRDTIAIAENRFSETGVQLHLHTPQLTAEGCLQFGPLSCLRYDIMGPFCCVPFMECRHSVRSMRHSVNGTLQINQTVYTFCNADGYIEGDRGRSFPKAYIWTQCSFPQGALMLSVAEIPLGRFHFTGVIGVILWHGKEYRLATYLGAKVIRLRNGEIVIRQGDTFFTARLLESAAQPLRAPNSGAMTRIIRESSVCHAAYRLQKNHQILFDFETRAASFEYEYP